MAHLYQITSGTSGFNYSVFKGCETYDGNVSKGTADQIIGGWAATKQQANEKVIEILED